MRNALAQARAELGPEALMFSTRLVARHGLRDWLGSREVELTVAHDSVMSGSRPGIRSADISEALGACLSPFEQEGQREGEREGRRHDHGQAPRPDFQQTIGAMVFGQLEVVAARLVKRRVHSYGFVAHDPAVRASVCLQQAVVFHHPHSPASLCFRMLASRVAGLRPLGAPGLKPLSRPVTRPEPGGSPSAHVPRATEPGIDLEVPQCA